MDKMRNRKVPKKHNISRITQVYMEGACYVYYQYVGTVKNAMVVNMACSGRHGRIKIMEI
jgi:hypothetical protein